MLIGTERSIKRDENVPRKHEIEGSQQVDFDSMTTDELATHFPPSEDNRWEFKSASYLTKDKRGPLADELGKQVSAFANTGGGFLIFGVEDRTNKFQECEQFVGRQSMSDFLSTKISLSVENPISGFRIHRIPFTSDPTQAVYLIAIPDSPAAPHQCKADRVYYWRLPGKSEPAPHFHLELLRNRFTKSVLEVSKVEYRVRCPAFHHAERSFGIDRMTSKLLITVDIHVKNVSLFSTTVWGVHVRYVGHNDFWKCVNSGANNNASMGNVCVRGIPDELLPGETAVVSAELETEIESIGEQIADHNLSIMMELSDFSLVLRTVSQNMIGEEFPCGICNSTDHDGAFVSSMVAQLRHQGHEI